MVKAIKSLFLQRRLFVLVGGIVTLFILTFILEGFYLVPEIIFYILLAALIADALLLYRVKQGLFGRRQMAARLSNGDENEIAIALHNYYIFRASVLVIDEVPVQFQRRDVAFSHWLAPGESQTIRYRLRPVKRGEYAFGELHVLVSSPLKLLTRKFSFPERKTVPVYPSYIQMRRYELLAIHHRLTDAGIKKIRRLGQNQEFELIKDYVAGDDFRTVNWKATARRSRIMVNQFQDERSQSIYCLIDKSRVMQMPFDGMSLLDYAINASLVICNIAIKKFDKAGLLSFQDKVSAFLPAGRLNRQMAVIQEMLFNQKTSFLESDFSAVHACVRKSISHRSLLLLFTNFESIHGLYRQLPYLQNLNRAHLLVVVFFENTELQTLTELNAEGLQEIYLQSVAERFSFEKKLIVRELTKHGIQSILTAPAQLTINTINKYLELKARNLI